MTKEQEDKIKELLKKQAEIQIPKEYNFAKEHGVLDNIFNTINITPRKQQDGKEIDIDGSIDDAIKLLQSLKGEGYSFIDWHAFGEYPEDGEAIMVWKDVLESEEELIERLGNRFVSAILEYYGLRRKEKEVKERLRKYVTNDK